MEITIREMLPEDWDLVAVIYKQGINTHKATFQTEIPTYEQWDAGHIKECRLVACCNDQVAGWAALSRVSGRYVYRGVAEVSIYINENCRGKGIGGLLLEKLIWDSEKYGYWTLQSVIFEENLRSMRLHKKFGFRLVGYREKIGKAEDGEWKNTLLLERRSKIVN